MAFLGFDNADEARRATDAAYDALRVWLARQRRTGIVPGPSIALGTRADDGPYTRLTLDGIAVGRIIEPDDALPYGSSYGFELLLPPGLAPSTWFGAAKVIDAALARRASLRGLEHVAVGAPGVSTAPSLTNDS